MIGLDLLSPLKAGACSARAHESWPGCGGRTFGDRQLYLVGGRWSAWEKRFGEALSTCGLYQGYHSERQPLFCPPLSRMSLETLERAHVWPPGSDHTATACTSAGVL
uniref:Uncharacterized protein n=1 Tax=Knipowitschia caucasica TaxID=637954 RepID=A0AAV2L3P3_KNICA